MQHEGQNGTKRAAHFSDDAPRAKKPRNGTSTIKHHKLRYKQASTVDPTLAPQDPEFIQGQLLRSIAIACGAVGFDGIKPTALESFRAVVEEYILNMLSLVHNSMDGSRRTQPIPQDFIHALASTNTSPAFLQEHLTLRELDSESSPFAPSVLQPRIPDPPPAEPPPPDLTAILGSSLISTKEKNQKSYIPKHFPPLPSRHTWRATPILSERERDPRKIRERATEEGMEAERALRKLVAARNASAAGRGQKKKAKGRKGKDWEEMWEETVDAVAKGDEDREKHTDMLNGMRADELDFSFDGAADEVPMIRKRDNMAVRKPDMDSGMTVNYEKKYWRKASAAISNG